MAPRGSATKSTKKDDGNTKQQAKPKDKSGKMDPKEVTKMLNFLRYRGDPEKNKKQDGLNEAQEALKTYEGLGNDAKASFLSSFQLANPGKTKNWNFVTSYSKTVVADDSDSVGQLSDFFTGPKILELNGLRWGDFTPEEADKVLQELLRENVEQHGYQPQSSPNDRMPILSKYFYIHSTGRQQTKTVSNKEQWEKKTTDKDIVMATLTDSTSSSSSGSGGGAQVKVENPKYAQFKEKLGLLQGSGTSLMKCEQQGDVLLSKFQVAGRNDAALKIKHEQLSKMMGTLKDFTAGVLLKVAEMEKIKENDKDMDKYLLDMTATLDTATHHIGGYREMYKRHNAMLG